MPKIEAKAKAAELQRQIATLTGHQSARVKPYGKHLLIQMRSDANDDSVDTIARLTELGRNSYSSAFRSHTGQRTVARHRRARHHRRVGRLAAGSLLRT